MDGFAGDLHVFAVNQCIFLTNDFFLFFFKLAGEHALHCNVTGASSELISLAQEAPVIALPFIKCSRINGFDFSIVLSL